MAKDGTGPSLSLDIRWLSCPYNREKALIALRSIEAGKILEILVESGEPFQSVKEGVQNAGHKVVLVEKLFNPEPTFWDYRIWVQKE
ncbi:MAG: sulfurtransferase TusA family protein [Elusimicrobia bacterium]|nr:sulfurtransferase TusA family protein [Elusimicrobiota bacterium]MBI3012999.1 sulfurtransferase TusA family protein [Elusimicrobiota bacterium]